MSERPNSEGAVPAPRPRRSPPRAERWLVYLILGLVAVALTYGAYARQRRIRKQEEFRALVHDGCQIALKVRSEIGVPLYRAFVEQEGEREIWERALENCQKEDPRILEIVILASLQPSTNPMGVLAAALRGSVTGIQPPPADVAPLPDFPDERILAWQGSCRTGDRDQRVLFIRVPGENKAKEMCWAVYLVMRME